VYTMGVEGLLISLIALAFVVASARAVVRHTRRVLRLYRHAVPITATVVDHEIVENERSSTYRPRVRFTTSDGRQISISTRDDLHEPPEPGQTITAVYDGQDPTYVLLRPPGIVRAAIFLGVVSPFALVATGWMIIVVLSLTGHVFGVTLIPPEVQVRLVNLRGDGGSYGGRTLRPDLGGGMGMRRVALRERWPSHSSA
jgi:hypothetical protein